MRANLLWPLRALVVLIFAGISYRVNSNWPRQTETQYRFAEFINVAAEQLQAAEPDEDGASYEIQLEALTPELDFNAQISSARNPSGPEAVLRLMRLTAATGLFSQISRRGEPFLRLTITGPNQRFTADIPRKLYEDSVQVQSLVKLTKLIEVGQAFGEKPPPRERRRVRRPDL